MNLTEEQEKVLAGDERLKICLAGPGSGKTTTVIEMVTRLTPEQRAGLALLSFTTAGAGEIRNRLKKRDVKVMFAGTTHSYCLSLLFREGRKIGLSDRLSVISQEAAKELIAECMTKLSYRSEPELVVNEIIRNPKLEDNPQPMVDARAFSVAMEYHTRMLQGGMLDYASILSYGLHLIKNGASWKPNFLVVDEAQDSSKQEWDIYRQLKCSRYVFVGDVDQSIYEWRGAAPQQLNSMCAKNPTAVRKITVNHRSGPAICNAATALISKNHDRVKKDIVSSGLVTSELKVVRFKDRQAEIAAVTKWAVENASNDVAILVRWNKDGAEVREALTKAGVKIQGRAEKPRGLTTAMAMMASAWTPSNDQLAYMFLKRKCGKARADKFKEMALEQMCSIALVGIEHYPIDWLKKSGRTVEITVPDNARLSRLVESVTDYGSDTFQLVLEVFNTLDESATADDLNVALDGDVEDTKGEGIWVSTIHNAKGKEWDQVMLPGWVDKKFPGRDTNEEQRRLAFVAITRAKQKAIITFADRMKLWHNSDEEPTAPSRYINELNLQRA